MMPAAVLTISAGIWLTRPSPTDERREGVRGLGRGHVELEHADDEAADEVDRGDDEAGDGVAAHELRGAVHRAVEVGVAGDLLAPARGPRFSSMSPALRSASIAICLPGMASRVKRAATSAIRPAPLVMTMKLMTIEDQEDHEPDDVVAADHGRAERVDHVRRPRPSPRISRVVATLSAEPEQRQQQQQRREDAELERVLGGQRRRAARRSRADAHREQPVEQRRRQRHDEQRRR